MFWRGACLLRGVSSLPAIKRKLRVNPPSLPRLITIYPQTDSKVKSQKKVGLKIIVIFFQSHFNFNFDPPSPPHSGLNQGVRPSYYNFQISPRTLCTISTDCFAETPVTVSFDHILCTFWSINLRRFTHQMTNH